MSRPPKRSSDSSSAHPDMGTDGRSAIFYAERTSGGGDCFRSRVGSQRCPPLLDAEGQELEKVVGRIPLNGKCRSRSEIGNTHCVAISQAKVPSCVKAFNVDHPASKVRKWSQVSTEQMPFALYPLEALERLSSPACNRKFSKVNRHPRSSTSASKFTR